MGRSLSDGFEVILIFFLLSFEIAQLCLCENSTAGCIDHEKQALLKFRDSFEDYNSSRYFTSWEGRNCCKWKGVKCDAITGHVVEIDLSSRIILRADMQEQEVNGSWFGPNFFPLEAKSVSSSLLELKYLNYLDLSLIRFRFCPIPVFFGSMKQLRYLNLSNSQFSGRVPHHLGNLTNLQVLDLSSYESPYLHIDDFTWVSQLSSLQYIDLSGVYIEENNPIQVIYKLPFLLQAHLMNCNISLKFSLGFLNSTVPSKVQVLNLGSNWLSGPIPDALRNLTNIRVLDLSDNFLDSAVPLWLGEFRNLVHLDLARNSLSGLFPLALQNMSSLSFLDLSNNILTSPVPLWLIKRILHVNLAHNKFSGIQSSPTWKSRNNCILTSLNDLQVLDLSHNEFNDHIASLGELKNLMYVNLSSNSFYGPIPRFFGKLTNLRELVLKDNQFNGTIPASLGRLSALRVLDLSGNRLNGIIPAGLGKLLNLNILDLSNNFLEGTLKEIHLSNLSYLQDLRIGLNKLSVKLAPNWLPPFQLADLQLKSCKIETRFPQWLQTQKKLINLDLSDTGIWGTFPKWFQQMNLAELDLSNNKISGPLPKSLSNMMPELNGLFLGNNLINGSIPKSLCKLQGLYNLDLSKNKLFSKIPSCLWQNNGMVLIDLSSNELSGTIPNSFCYPGSILQSLNLSNNSLHGKLPLYLGDCIDLAILDLGDNQLSGVIPLNIGEDLPSLQILRLRQNMFWGSIPLNLCQLPKMQSLDLANNNLTGTIPHCIGSLAGMILDVENETLAPSIADEFPAPAPGPIGLLVLSPDFDQWDKEDVKQVMKGRELDFTRNLKFVVNMDLSNNRLTGFIPEVLSSLSKLVSLNLSHNNLSGTIPSKIGKLKSLESLDFSTNQLSGPLPSSMSSLTSLSHLNLSYNNFSGPIPEGNQFFTLEDPSVYVGNPYLCGAPVLNKCQGNDTHQAPTSSHFEDNESNRDEKEKILFYFVIALGFMTGFWGAIGVLVFNKSWRHAYFGCAEKVGDKIYVVIAIKVARHKRMGRMGRNQVNR